MRRSKTVGLWGVAAVTMVVLLTGCPNVLFWHPRVLKSSIKMSPGAESALVNITGDVHGLVVSPEKLRVKPGQTVSWTSALDKWEIDLAVDGPARDRVLVGTANATVQTTIRLNSYYRKYKYSVSAEVEGRLVVVDPEIIVDPPPDTIPG